MPNTAQPDVSDRLDAELDAQSEDQAAAEQVEDAHCPAPATPRSPLRRATAATLLAALAIAIAAYAGYAGWRLHQIEARDAAAAAALAAAKEYALTLTTLDTADIDGNYARALDGATGAFKDAYSLGAKQLRQILIDNNATGKGIVIDAAVKSATPNRAEVLLFADQAITNAVRTEPRIDRNRIQMTMELIDGHWLASQVDLV